MRIAADAGVAPTLHHVDDAAGVAVMDFLPQRRLSEYSGGADGLAQADRKPRRPSQAAQLFRRCWIISRSSAACSASCAAQPVRARTAGPASGGFRTHPRGVSKDAAASVSSHNDPNFRNTIFDGDRLWLIDWETAYRNDPLVDVAILLDQLAATPGRAEVLLQAWLGSAPDAALRARLVLMRPLTRLYYAGLALSAAAARRARPDADLNAPSPAQLQALYERGQLEAAAPDTLYILGKMQPFLAGLAAPGFEDARRRRERLTFRAPGDSVCIAWQKIPNRRPGMPTNRPTARSRA